MLLLIFSFIMNNNVDIDNINLFSSLSGTICQQLDRSLKETQYEIEKLEEVKSEVEAEVNSFVSAIEDWIKLADTSDRDRDRLWLYLNADEDNPVTADLEGDDFRHNEYFS